MAWSNRIIAVALAALAVVAGPRATAAGITVRAPGGGDYQLPVTSLRDLPFRTVVRQRYDFSCGSAALATLLRFHYGVPVDEAGVFTTMYAVGDQAQIRKLGFSLLDMKRYLATRGMRADGYRLPLDVLARTRTPALAVIKLGSYRHFVVIKGLRGGTVLVGDPAVGMKAYSARAFSAIWDGVIFVIHARDDQSGVQTAVFDNDREWAAVPFAPLRPATAQDQPVSDLTRGLPLQFQVTQSVASASFGSAR